VIGPGATYAYSPRIAVDSNGNAIAVWRQFDGSGWRIWANRFTWTNRHAPSGGWETDARPISVNNTPNAGSPRIAVDTNGNALVVWDEQNDNRNRVWVNRFTWENRFLPTGGWDEQPRPISSNSSGNASSPQIAIDPKGDAIAVWNQWNGAQWNIVANRFTWTNRLASSGGWEDSARTISANDADATNPQIVIDPNSNAVVVWRQWDGTRHTIWANHFNWELRVYDGGGWGLTTQRLSTAEPQGAHPPQVAVDANGNAIAVWPQQDDNRFQVMANRFTWANRYSWNGGWEAAPRSISDHDSGNAINSQIAIDRNGNAVVVWVHEIVVGFLSVEKRIWSNHYAANIG
jgi:hypothetical protein